MNRFSVIVATATVLLLSSKVAAQSPSVSVGDRVRVVYRCPAPGQHERSCSQNGLVQLIRPDTIHVSSEGGRGYHVIPAASVEKLWVRDGTTGHFWTGAGIGIIAGMLLGAAIGSTQEFCMFSCSPATGIGLMIGAPVGFMVGGVVGTFVRTDRWRPVEPGVPPPARLGHVGGVQLGASVAF